MKAYKALLFAGGVIYVFAALAAHAATGPAVPGFEAYDQTIPALLQKWDVPGAAVTVAHRGKIVFARGYGYADRDTKRPVQPDTRFRLASISKTITAVMVLKLIEEGRLSLEDHPYALLKYPTPTYRGAVRDSRLEQITVRHLLEHTAGWNRLTASNPFYGGTNFDPQCYQREIAGAMGVASPASPETIIRYMIGQPLQFTPGTSCAYSPLGYAILGRLIELKTGLPYAQAVEEFMATAEISSLRIGGTRRSELAADEAVYYDYPAAPLVPSHLDPGNVAGPYQWSLQSWDAQGGWIMSPIECVRFLLALEGTGATLPLLQPATVADMRTEHTPAVFGYGWQTRDYQPETGHGGAMPGSCTLALRSSDGTRNTVLFFNSLPSPPSTFVSEALNLLRSVSTLPPLNADMTATTLGWDAWLDYNLSANAAFAGPLDDPEQDGVPNLLEYAAGLDPLIPEPRFPATVHTQSDGSRVLSYRRIVLEHPLTWTVETGTDGQDSWRASADAGRLVGVYADGTQQMTLPIPANTRGRVRVRQNASGAEAAFTAVSESNEPVILTLTTDISATAGGTVTFSAAASGRAPLSYQWTKNGAVIAGATNASFTLSNFQASDAGAYSVTISNEYGTLASTPNTLAVNQPTPTPTPTPTPSPSTGSGSGGGGAPSPWFLASLVLLRLLRWKHETPGK